MPLYRPSDAQSDRDSQTKRSTARGVERQARRVLTSIPLSGNPSRFGNRRSTPPNGSVIPAIVTTAIPAASGTTPSSTGVVQLYYVDSPDSSTVTADVDSGASVTVLNWYVNSGTIAIGTNVWVVIWGQWAWLLTADC